MKRYRTVALVSREPGLRVLTEVLLTHPRLDMVSVFTHRNLTRREGGGERPDYPAFENACARRDVPLIALETSDGRESLVQHLPPEPIDLLFVLSWRLIVPPTVLDRLRCGGINIHRGALPAYAGGYPVQRAIEAGERRVAISAIDLAEGLDTGDPLAVAWLDIPPQPRGQTAEAYAEIVKRRLYPFYAPLARLAIDLRIAATETAGVTAMRALLFDLDGTVADSLAAMREAFYRFAVKHGGGAHGLDFERFNGPPLTDIARTLKTELGIEAPMPHLIEDYEAAIDAVYEAIQPSEGVAKIIATAREAGWDVGIVTSNGAARTRRWLARTGLAPYCTAIVCGGDVSQGKPHPAPYLEALRRIGRDASDAAAIEDSAQGASAAIAAGLRTYFYRPESRPAPDGPCGAIPFKSFVELGSILFETRR